MKRCITFILLSATCVNIFAGDKDSILYYQLPDSIKTISFLAEINVGTLQTRKEVFAGIKTEVIKLSLESDKNEREIVFEFPPGASVMVNGPGVKTGKGELSWEYNWSENENYRLLIATAGDSAGNFALYSGYIFLPKEKKWKLIGTCKISGQWNSLKQPAAYFSNVKKTPLKVSFNEAWCQRQNGSWKNLSQQVLAPPMVNLLSHFDSLEQLQMDKKIIVQAIAENKIPGMQEHGGIYYTTMKEGNGRQVIIDDTVTVYYKGYLFSDGSVFDETKDKPATFPLKRLIMGWQIGVPLCKVGGKIKIIIPSGLAYSIRTRAAKIPPNSILVFEVEVVDAKLPQ